MTTSQIAMTMMTTAACHQKVVCRGSYVQATADVIVTNDQKPRTHGCIALGPLENQQGSLKCFDLETGMVVIWRIVKVFPMPDRVVKQVNAWGIKTKKGSLGNEIARMLR